ncbi:Fc.00g095730.m01.CDS01 [Cosmosporella sp. VM-42]
MDSHLQPQPAGGPAASPAASPSPSRRSSRYSLNPATPGAASETADNYFEPLSELPSAQSRISVPSTFRRPSSSGRPALEGRNRSSIRLRRSSNASLSSTTGQIPFPALEPGYFDNHDGFQDGRPRSISQPERARVNDGGGISARHSRRVPQVAMPRLTEEGARPTLGELGVEPTSPLSPTLSLPENTTAPQPGKPKMQRARNISRMFWPGHRRQPDQQTVPPAIPNPEDEYTQDLVDWLDIIDPEVQTLSTLTNVQNSLFIPDLGNWVNRRPTYVLSERDPEQQWAREAAAQERRQEVASIAPTQGEQEAPPIQRSNTITSRLTESHYAALPHGTNLEGWTAEEKSELDDHVRHMLHSRRARFKRRLKGFGQYIRRPLGFFVTLYATLITLFGLAWVLFLIGWIYVGEKQVYAIHVIDSVLVALFAVMGDGLAPFRMVDTYHMIYIARYARMIKNAKKGKRPRSRLQKKNIPPEIRESLERAASTEQPRVYCRPPSPDRPDILSPINEDGSQEEHLVDVESAKSELDELDYSPLTPKQQADLEHHQQKLAKSHSFYKPHQTFTHYAFPLDYLIAIVVLLDCHSCLQISLGACTWGINYHHRPFALTTVILCVSITCNITAGLVITMGDRKTRKKDVMNLLDRQELTGDAIKHIEEKRKKEQEKEQEKEDSLNGGSSWEGKLMPDSSRDDESEQEKGPAKLTKAPT